MNDTQTHLCPVERAGALDMSLRKIAHNPRKILKPYIKTGLKCVHRAGYLELCNIPNIVDFEYVIYFFVLEK